MATEKKEDTHNYFSVSVEAENKLISAQHYIPDDRFLDPKRRFLYILLFNMIKNALCILFLCEIFI